MKRTLIIIFTSFLINAIITTQTLAKDNDNVRNILINLGLENIQIEKSKDKYSITYENRTFLHEIHLLGKILSDLKNEIDDNQKIVLYPQKNGQKIIKIALDYEDYLRFIKDQITQEELAERIDFSMNPIKEFSSKETNDLLFHTDLVLAPGLNLGVTEGPTIFFAPYLNSFFDNGLKFSSRFRLPIYNAVNSFDFQKNTELFPLSFLFNVIDYSVPIENIPLYTTFRFGHWLNDGNEIALSNETRYLFLDGLLNANLKTGYTYNPSKSKSDFSISSYGQIYIGNLDLIIEAGAGKFLFDSYGFWGRTTRQFDNVDIGFSLYRTFFNDTKGWQFNFEYNIAIGPEHSINASEFRITYPQFFGGLLNSGTGSRGEVTNGSTELFINRLFPELIKTHLYYWKLYK